MGDAHRIAVIGAGPAGTCFALALLKLGVDPGDILLFDRALFPRQKLCGGAITHRGTVLLQSLVGVLPQPTETQQLEVRSRLGTLVLREPGPQWLYDRHLLDFELVKECRKCGVEVRDGAAVTELSPCAGGWRIATDAGASTAEWVIGADGANGITRRAAKLDAGITGRLIEGVFEIERGSVNPDRLIFDFEPIFDGIPGYAWIFPYPKPGVSNLWKIGIMDGRGVTAGSRLREWTEAYAERNGFRAVESKLAGWPERYYSRRLKAHRPGLILIGEAHGIDPLLGEGITPAVQTALYAAKRLQRALDRGQQRIRGYEFGFLMSEEGWNLYFHEFLADRLYGPDGARWLELLFESPEIQRLGMLGETGDGKMARRAPQLIKALLRHTLRRATS